MTFIDSFTIDYPTITFTLEDFIAAIEKNGLNQIKGQLFRRDAWGELIGACAYGQAIYNLTGKTTGDPITHAVTKFPKVRYHCPYYQSISDITLNLVSAVTHLNDYHGYTFKEIGEILRQEYTPEQLQTSVTVTLYE